MTYGEECFQQFIEIITDKNPEWDEEKVDVVVGNFLAEVSQCLNTPQISGILKSAEATYDDYMD